MGDLQALVIGRDIFYPSFSVNEKTFHFKPEQNQFLLAHQKTKSVEMAAIAVGKDIAWAQAFLSSPKFKRFIYSKMAQFSAQNGMTIEWWHQFGKWLVDGYKEHYSYQCSFCQYKGEMNTYEAETYRDDDNRLKAECQVCYKPIDLDYVKEEFKPTREQVEGWKEVGSRIIPKIERITHQFERSEFVFEEEKA